MNITKKIKEQATKLFKENPHIKKLYVNKKGEFFTSENLATLSVKDPKKEIAVINNETVVAPEKGAEKDGEPKKD